LLLGAALFFSGCDSYTSQDTPGDPAPVPCVGVGILCHVSGSTGEAGGAGDNGPAADALHYWPMDITMGTQGKFYIVDWNNHRVREVDANGIMTTIIGSGNLGDDYSGDATSIDLNHPVSLTIGDDGNYYLASWHNWKIKVIDKNTNQVSAPVGTTQGFLGDEGPATGAKMDIPSSLAFDFDGNMFISDQGNFRIRKVGTDGMIHTFAGGERGFADGIGTAAMFDAPKGPDATPGGKIAMDDDRTVLYVADTNNNRIRKIDPASAATLNAPRDVYVSHDGDIYIADTDNHAIRKIDANGIITTVVGTGVRGSSEGGEVATAANLNRPMGVVYDEGEHTLYVADTFNHQVWKVDLDHN
jgi:DNA-binding beta-propeller fold protein YncE